MGVKIFKKKLVESYSISTVKMDNITANDFFSGMKEEIEYDINPELSYYTVTLTGKDDKRVYIEIEPQAVEECNGVLADEIYDNDYSGFLEGELGCDSNTYLEIQDKVRREYDKLSKQIIPKLARAWGFRKT